MIKYVLLRIIKIFNRLLLKVINLLVPIISRILIWFNLQSGTVNLLNKLRSQSHKTQDHYDLISKLLNTKKLIALDAGAQGGFLNGSIFPKRYNSFFSPIVVEPISEEAKKLKDKNYKVVEKGLWSSNCKKKLYILGKRPGSSSMYKPNKDIFDLYDFKKKNFHLFDISKEIEVNCSTIMESLNELSIKNLDFLKVDTQGAELEILKGLGEYYPLMMKIELQIIPMYHGVPNWSKLLEHIYNLNYMTCEWIEIGSHLTRTPAEMDMIFIPNYLSEKGKKIILSKENEFISLMLIFGHIKLLQNISTKLNFSANQEIQKLSDNYFK